MCQICRKITIFSSFCQGKRIFFCNYAAKLTIETMEVKHQFARKLMEIQAIKLQPQEPFTCGRRCCHHWRHNGSLCP